MQKKNIYTVVGVAATMLSTSASAAIADRTAVIQKAEQQISAHAAALYASAADSFKAKDVIVDANGSTHVRFDRSYNGLRVIGGDFVVHSDASGAFKSASQTLSRSIKVGTDAAFPASDAIAVADASFAGVREGKPSITKVIYARGATPVLAYDVVQRGYTADGTPTKRHAIIDAASNKSLDAWDDVQTATATATGNSLTLGVLSFTDSTATSGFQMIDPTRGNGSTVDVQNARFSLTASLKEKLFTDADNVWGNSTNSDRATAAVDATVGAAATWDYYKVKFGRNGIDNDGIGAKSRVHYSVNYVNAYWSDDCFCMTYGDGDGSTYLPLVALDVAGHEMTHGVTSHTAGLTYSGESGGLNESISDIFGTLVEFQVNSSFNPPNYLLGERIYASQNGVAVPTQALRYEFKPSLDGKSPDCYTSAIGNLDVHYSSGVQNHFFYLLTQGTAIPAGFGSLTPASLVCNGNTALVAISRDQAAQIIYRALTVYMTSSTNYAGSRAAMLSAATDLYGSTSQQYKSVAAAWSAVSVN